MNEGEYEPDVAQAEQGTCDCAQNPGAFPQAEHLGDAVPGHRQDHQHPDPPGDTRQAFLGEHEDKAGYEHGCVDGEVASAQAKLMSIDVEGVRGNLRADEMQRKKQRFGNYIKPKV